MGGAYGEWTSRAPPCSSRTPSRGLEVFEDAWRFLEAHARHPEAPEGPLKAPGSLEAQLRKPLALEIFQILQAAGRGPSELRVLIDWIYLRPGQESLKDVQICLVCLEKNLASRVSRLPSF